MFIFELFQDFFFQLFNFRYQHLSILSDGETVFLHNEISSIIDRLSSPSKNKPSPDHHSHAEGVTNKNIDTIIDMNPSMNTALLDINSKVNSPSMTAEANSNTDTEVTKTNEQMTTVIESQHDFIEEMQMDSATVVETAAFVDVDKFRQMIPYNTDDPVKINQQESILELLISNGICNDETFQIFIAEPDLHKEKASQILDSLYCVNTMMPIEYENDAAIEWVNSVESMSNGLTPDSIAIEGNSNGAIETNSIEICVTSAVVHCDATTLDHSTAQSHASSECELGIFLNGASLSL